MLSRFVALALFVFGVWGMGLTSGCGSSGAQRPEETGKRKPRPTPQGKIGDACLPVAWPLAPGSCTEGLVCGSAPGGVCTSFAPCAPPAVTVDSPSLGAICAPPCTGDADCRAHEGYVCDPRWSACVSPSAIAPAPPVCETPPPPLAHKTFGKPLALTTTSSGGKAQVDPTAVVNDAGDLFVLYGAWGGLGEPAPLGSVRRTVKGAVTSDSALSIEPLIQRSPQVVTGRDGRFFMGYLRDDGPQGGGTASAVVLTSSGNAKLWPDKTDVSTPEECSGAPCYGVRVAVGPNVDDLKGDAVYVLYRTGAGALHVRRSVDGGKTFPEAPVTVAKSGAHDALVSSSGKLYIIYVTPEGANGTNPFGDAENVLYFTSSADGGKTFGVPVRVSAPGESLPLWFSSPRLVADLAQGILYAVFTSGTSDGKWDIQLAASIDAGASWTHAQVTGEENCMSHMLPAAAVDEKTGRVHIAWLENRGGEGAVAWTTCLTGGSSCDTAERASEAPFATYGFVRHDPRSLGDQIDLALDEKRRSLHVVWTQPVDEAGAVVGRIYEVTAKLK